MHAVFTTGYYKDIHIVNETEHDKTNKMVSAPSKGSNQLGHAPSPVLAVRLKKHWLLSYP